MAIRKRESNGEYWGNDLWRHWCHFLCKLINRTYYVFLIHDVRRRKVIKYYKKQKVWKLTIKNFSTFCHRTFCKQLFYHFCHYIKQKQKFLLGNQDIKKKQPRNELSTFLIQTNSEISTYSRANIGFLVLSMSCYQNYTYHLLGQKTRNNKVNLA